MLILFWQVLLPQLEPLTDTQVQSVNNLRQSSQQAEDALSQGMEKLQQSLAQSIGTESVNSSNYGSQMVAAMNKLEAVEGFVNQVIYFRWLP
jgi:transcription factor TGA